MNYLFLYNIVVTYIHSYIHDIHDTIIPKVKILIWYYVLLYAVTTYIMYECCSTYMNVKYYVMYKKLDCERYA